MMTRACSNLSTRQGETGECYEFKAYIVSLKTRLGYRVRLCLTNWNKIKLQNKTKKKKDQWQHHNSKIPISEILIYLFLAINKQQ